MMEPIVRLASLKLVNIKNVKNGTIVLPNVAKRELSASRAEILGIYGQNGSVYFATPKCNKMQSKNVTP